MAPEARTPRVTRRASAPGRVHHGFCPPRRLLGVGGEGLVEPRGGGLVVADAAVPPLVRELVRDHVVDRRRHDQRGVLHRRRVGDDDLQVRPAVGAEQRDQPRQPPAHAAQRPAQRRRCAAPQTVTATPATVARSERRRPAAKEKSRPCSSRQRPVGLRRARRRHGDAARRAQAHRPVRGRIGPRLAAAEVAVEPPAAALEVGERGDGVGEQRHAAAPAPEAVGDARGTRMSTSNPTAAARPRRQRRRQPQLDRRAAHARPARRPRRSRCRSRTARGARAAVGPVAPQPHPHAGRAARARVGERDRLAALPAEAAVAAAAGRPRTRARWGPARPRRPWPGMRAEQRRRRAGAARITRRRG